MFIAHASFYGKLVLIASPSLNLADCSQGHDAGFFMDQSAQMAEIRKTGLPAIAG